MNNKIKILIGDDSVEFGVCYASALREKDFYVITRSKDGRVLFDAIRNEQPDVVICDAVLPNLDAIELLKRINASDMKKPLMIITSNYDNPFVEKAVMANGAAYFLLIHTLGGIIHAQNGISPQHILNYAHDFPPKFRNGFRMV